MTNRLRSLIALILIVAAGTLGTAPVFAATAAPDTLSRNAWIPYWKATQGIIEILPHITSFTSVSPFGYAVQADGSIKDLIGMNKGFWPLFLNITDSAGVAVYPTVMWSDGTAMLATLSDTNKRAAHEDAVIAAVLASKSVDGIEIDYENKPLALNAYFSAYLTEMSAKLHAKGKKLVCDIEARTPIADRVAHPTAADYANVAYVNDYKVIGQACDEVRVMAYDQGRISLPLNKTASMYAPVADAAWVKRVLASTTTDIAPNKITLGIPTYGRVYRIETTGYYAQIGAVNYPDALALAKTQGAKLTRTGSELTFSYSAYTSGLPTAGTPTGTKNKYFVSVSDAAAIGSEVAVARTAGLGGVSLFKLDGSTDPAVWSYFLK